MSICKIENCSLEVYPDETKCILHCKKGNYSVDSRKSDFLSLFYTELINYIVSIFFRGKNSVIDKNNFKKYLEEHEYFEQQKTTESTKKPTITLTGIVFPERDDRDHFDYLPVLNKLKAIHFNYCEFMLSRLDLSNTRCFFQDCQFHERWYILNSPILNKIDNSLYQECTFYNTVVSCPEGDNRYVIDAPLFDNCEFKKNLEFEGIDFNAPVFNNTDKWKAEIDELRLIDCTFHDKFILNNCTIRKYLSEGSVFHSTFNFKNNIIQNFKTVNTNHFKVVDTYRTKYTKFKIIESTFEDFVGLENCEFGVTRNASSEYVAIFMHATFLSFVNFRNTKFYGGLDIERINLKEPPNFLNIQIEFSNSNRETFRIIKNSFDKIGNNIEANKIFVCEMKKYKEEMLGAPLSQEKIIFYLNEKISNFGQSYIMPICWLVMASILYTLLDSIYLPDNSIIVEVSKIINNVAVNILPFSKILKSGMEFISLLFYIIFVILIWQVIVAVKRQTRR